MWEFLGGIEWEFDLGMGMKINNPGNGNVSENCYMGMGGNGNQKPIPEHLYPESLAGYWSIPTDITFIITRLTL